MITRAVVEQVIDTYKFKIRIPVFDGIEQSSMHTSFNDLPVATACLPKGVVDSIKVGDVVFVGFENNSYSEPLILGHLYREGLNNTNEGVAIVGKILQIAEKAVLPVNTSIGKVNGNQLSYLLNVRSDIQAQLDSIMSQIAELKK